MRRVGSLFRTAVAVAASQLGLSLSSSAIAAGVRVDPHLPEYSFQRGLTGTVTVARAASTATLVDAWIQGFMAIQPGVVVRQTAKGTDQPAVALRELLDGKVDLAPFAREIQPQELAAAARRLGYDPLGIAVASGSYATPSNTHAIALYVNAANPLGRITLAQLDAIYSLTRRRGYPTPITRWGQLGLTGAWADRPIHPYGMVIRRKTGNPHSGIVAYLMDRLLLGGEFNPATRQCPDTGMGRGNNRALDEIVQAVAADPDAIGYSGFANRRPGTKTLALAESAAGPFFSGTPEQVADRVYPLTRTIFVFMRRRPGQPLYPMLAAFLHFVLSRQGQEAVANDQAHFLPLPAAFAAEQRHHVDP